MERYSTSNPAQSLNPSPLIKFLYHLFRQEADQVRRSSGSEAEVFYDNTRKLRLNSLASSSIRSTSGDCLDLVRRLLPQNRLWYSNSVAIMLSNEFNGKFILSLGTLESCSTSHAQSLNPRPPDPLIKFLCRLFQKEAGAFLCSEAQAMCDNTKKQYLNSLASSHIQSTPKGCIDVLRGLLWYSSSFPDMLRYQLNGQFIQSLATEHYSSAIEICTSLASEVASHILRLEFILNSPSLMPSNKLRRAFGLFKELVPNCPEVLRRYRLRNFQVGFGGDFELSGTLADDLDCVITQNSSSSLCWLPIAETKNEKQKEVTSGAASASSSGSGSSSSSHNSSSNTSSNAKESSDRTETKDGDDTSSDEDDEREKEEDDSSSDEDDLAIAVRLIPLMERAVDGTLIQRAQLRTDHFWGYGSLASLVRHFSPYSAPLDSMVHILWPWVEHTPVYFGGAQRVLNPRTRWEDFASKLTEIHMLPVEEGGPAFVYVPGKPDEYVVQDAPILNKTSYYWLRFRQRFRQPPIHDEIWLIRRNAISSYRSLFWIINGLWASWHGKEPLDAEKITEANFVQEGFDFVLPRPDSIKILDDHGKELKLPRFLTGRLKALKLLEELRKLKDIKKTSDEDADEMDMEDEDDDEDTTDEDQGSDENYPDDDNYESIWDFLTQVYEVVITRRPQPTP